jgi:hypothetical protein
VDHPYRHRAGISVRAACRQNDFAYAKLIRIAGHRRGQILNIGFEQREIELGIARRHRSVRHRAICKPNATIRPPRDVCIRDHQAIGAPDHTRPPAAPRTLHLNR